jgi:hypothetical protein
VSDIEVVTADLRHAAEQIGSAADGVGTADPHATLDAVGSALPGSATAGAASTLTAAWRSRFAAWSADARAQQQELDASAASYDGTDELAASQLARHGTGAE